MKMKIQSDERVL